MGKVTSNECLGLFDTPPNRQQIRLALIVVALQLAAFAITFPFSDVRLPPIQPFVPMMDSITFVGEMIIGALLYAQATVFRSRALTVLASGYVFGTLMIIPHALTFPGAFSERGLLGAGFSTAGWFATFWWWALPASVIIYVLVSRTDAAGIETEQPNPRIREGFVGAILLAAFVTLLATKGHDLLPPLYVDGREAASTLLIFNLVSIALLVVAIVMLFLKCSSVLEMWLIVVLAGYLIQNMLILGSPARFTVGWYGNFASILFSNLIVMLALLSESTQLYARLALSTAARAREFEARLMSTDAVAAAIAHEIGQPLAAVKLTASAASKWLDRPNPDVAKAIQSLREISDSNQRSFDIIRNIRSIFAKGPAWAIEFNLNDLVQETVTLLDQELAGAKVSLQLKLDDSVPAILANRVQMQQVLVNLLTNAIESLAATRGRRRRITIRSTPLEDHTVLLEVSDSGVGISADELSHIFDAFHTTKRTGTGIGLSLCRTIVEEHGGYIKAFPGEKYGATFRVQLPRNRFAPRTAAFHQ